jgi:FkbM family methyltransferase
MISSIYNYIFSRGLFGKINNRLLYLALQARGYGNFRNNKETGESFFIDKVLAPTNPQLCIDIGANIGKYTNEILKKTNSRVISFEPLSTTFKKLAETTEHQKERVKLENKGVSNKTGMLTIHYNPNALAHASFSEDIKKVGYVSNKEKADVQVITLDRYCEENEISEIDLVKMDTEGFEAEVFEGAKNTFSKIKPKFIQIEFNWHQLFRNTTLNYFAEQLPDYEVYQLIPNNWIKRDPRDPLSNIYFFSNFVFIRKT